jgi:2-desacetyl-2-hydroxyethyl bacteriochlorophyllide A dehydrogenase
MKAIICEKPGALAVVAKPEPVRQAGEVKIRIRRVGLCGTDFHIITGNQPYLQYPRVMGHELAGEVAEADEGSERKPGETVTLNPYLPCGECIACRKGKPNCCTHIRVLGVHIDGGMAEYVCVPEAAVIPIADLSLDQAAMVEFLCIGAHAVRRARLETAERVLVVGAGPIGVAAALFARLAGADVSLIDTSMQRLDYASRQLGFEHVHAVADDVTSWLAGRTDGDMFDCVFDATGSAKAIEKGFDYVAHGGRYVLISVVKDAITFSDPEFHKREMQLIGSRNATRADFEYVIDCIRNGALPTDRLKTHAFALIDMAQVVPELLKDQGSVLKAIGSF